MKVAVQPRRGRRILVSVGALVGVLVLAYGMALASTGSSQLARAVVWLEADVDDLNRFPSRLIEASAPSALPTVIDESIAQAAERLGPTLGIQGDLDSYLADTDSTAFLVIKDGMLIHEWYVEGIERETLQTSFSVAKSFLSTLIGLAIADGSIGSVDDPITTYVPELLERDARFGDITIENLLTMSSGLVYEEGMTPWSDAASTYYSPDLRATALSATISEGPGDTWLYNNYNPLLLGLALERATGKSVSEYMSSELWGPLGAEGDASWSLDSDASGFEKLESGVNARAVDFARFGLMMLNDGMVDGEQVVPYEWVREATAVDTTKDPADFYQYFWWVYPQQGAPRDVEADFAAQGNFGQFIYVAPNENMVLVRLGRDDGGVAWTWLMGSLARDVGAQAGPSNGP